MTFHPGSESCKLASQRAQQACSGAGCSWWSCPQVDVGCSWVDSPTQGEHKGVPPKGKGEPLKCEPPTQHPGPWQAELQWRGHQQRPCSRSRAELKQQGHARVPARMPWPEELRKPSAMAKSDVSCQNGRAPGFSRGVSLIRTQVESAKKT